MMSSFFRALRASYQAEIDDLTFDSEGRDVLRQRLVTKRKEIVFLKQMMEISPEMVAVVFHRGFKFEQPAVMDHLLTLESDEFPDWDSLVDAVQLTPWAQELATVMLQEPQGAWFMTVAAGLEYLYHRAPTHHHEGDHPGAHAEHAADEHEPGAHSGRANQRHHDHGHDFDADDEHDHQRHDHEHEHAEASSEWLEGQGFDRKD
jgi:hypothetical protein